MNINSDRKFPLAALIFFLVLALLGIAGFVLTAAVKFIAAAVLCVLVGIIGFAADRNSHSKRGIIGRIVALVIILFFMFSMPSLIILPSKVWQYPFQKFYTGLYRNVREPDWFPDFRNDVQSDYIFDYMPSIMQGTGYFSVCFVTSPERASEYERKFSSQAEYIVSLDEFTAASRYSVGGDSNDPWEVLDIYWNRNFWKKGEEPSAQIYVLDAVLNYNHPYSSAVIIDTESGRIQLSQLG